MKLEFIRRLSVILILAGSLCAFANEGGGEGGEGGGEGGAKEEAKSSKPWQEDENKLSALRSKSAAQDKTLRELIEERKKTTGREQITKLEAEINKAYEQLRETNEELRKQESRYRYRYPERTAKEGERTYHTQEVPELDKIEEQVGIEAKIRRNIRKMKSQYGTKDERKSLESSPVNGEGGHGGAGHVGSGHGEGGGGPGESSKPKDEKSILEQDSPTLSK